MISRRIERTLEQRLAQAPAVVLLGPRQVGKTTLALRVAESGPSVYLDLESERDRARLAEPELYLADHAGDLVILDEVQRLPGLFETLRGVIDQGRRAGRRTRRFLLLGSATNELLQQSGESLAGRVSHLELAPLDPIEIAMSPAISLDDLWVRGGFPESLTAVDLAASMRWRLDFIRTYLERDIPQLGPRIPAETLRRFWTMLAHQQGGLFNAAVIARGLGVEGKTVARYLDLMVDLLLVRRLPPLTANVGKRLVRSPKVYVRDSGIVHALLGLETRDAVLGHPVAGGSWEGMAIEYLLDVASDTVDTSFYRTSGGAEVDLVLTWPDGRRWFVEVKRSLSPRPRRGFASAWRDLQPERGFVVYPGQERYRVGERIEAIDLLTLCRELAAAR